MRQAESSAVYDYERVCVGQIYAVFDDGRGYENVKFLVVKRTDSLLELTRRHLSVSSDNPCALAHTAQSARKRFERLDIVEKHERLTSSCKFARDCVGAKRVTVSHDVGLNWQPASRRGFEHGNISHARKRHIKRARYRRCRERKHIDERIFFFEFFLVFDTETLLFVKHEQA